MRVVIVKYEGQLSPLISSETETVGDLIHQWKKNSNQDSDSSFAMRLVDTDYDSFISTATFISELPLPRPGYSSIEITAHLVSSIKLSFGAEKVLTLAVPLSASLSQLRAACIETSKCGEREIVFMRGDTRLSGSGTLEELGLGEGQVVTAETPIFLVISRLGHPDEATQVSSLHPLRVLFSDEVPASDQRFYDSVGRQVNADEPSVKSLGLPVGVSKEDPVRLLFVRRMALRIRLPPQRGTGFVAPEDQVVQVWPHKSVSCLVPREKAELGLMVWFNGRALPKSATFWEKGVGPHQLLYLDKKMTVKLMDVDKEKCVDLELRRAARIKDLVDEVAKLDNQRSFDLFVAGQPLSGPETSLLRKCGVRDGVQVEKRSHQIQLVFTYEDEKLPPVRLPIGASFRTVLERAQQMVGQDLPANTFLECRCGRRLSADPEKGQDELPEWCCEARPRHMRLHRILNVKVVEESGRTRHVHMDSCDSLETLLNELGEEAGARLLQEGVERASADLLKDCEQYLSNRVQLMLERKLMVGVRTRGELMVRWLWPSSALGALMQSLKTKGVLGEGRTSVWLQEKKLASYGGKIAVCRKKLTEYGVVDGSVIDVKIDDEEDKEEEERRPGRGNAEFLIICNKWNVANFIISVPAPPTIRSIFQEVTENLKGTERESIEPVLAQVQAPGHSGNVLLFAASNRWVNNVGDNEEPVFSPKFQQLSSPVLFVPGLPTKIHVRGWRDGSSYMR